MSNLSTANALGIILCITSWIVGVVLSFYLLHDEWDEAAMGEGIILKDDGIIEMTAHETSSNVFLKRIFDSGYNEWIFKVVEFDSKWPAFTKLQLVF